MKKNNTKRHDFITLGDLMYAMLEYQHLHIGLHWTTIDFPLEKRVGFTSSDGEIWTLPLGGGHGVKSNSGEKTYPDLSTPKTRQEWMNFTFNY